MLWLWTLFYRHDAVIQNNLRYSYNYCDRIFNFSTYLYLKKRNMEEVLFLYVCLDENKYISRVGYYRKY